MRHLQVWNQAGTTLFDTIFLNEKRAQTYDFTKPYTEIDVPIFFNKMISGIKDADTAKGFSVAVKGDNAINVLRQHGHENLMEFDSYEEIVKQAKANKVTVLLLMSLRPFIFYIKWEFRTNSSIQSHYTPDLFTGRSPKGTKKFLIW